MQNTGIREELQVKHQLLRIEHISPNILLDVQAMVQQPIERDHEGALK